MFRIDLLEQDWLDGCDAASDLCSHGRLRIVIGDTTVADGEDNFGISESALGLMRTLKDDRHSALEEERLIVCGCGLILMMNCPFGIDWDVEHAGDLVRVRNVVVDDGACERDLHVSTDVPRAEYRQQVVALAKAVKDFFGASPDKVFDDSFDRDQYLAFWQEFDARLAAAS